MNTKELSFSLTVEQINWGHIASVIRLSSKPNMSSKETARTKYTDIRERATTSSPRAQKDPSIGTQDLSSLTLDQLQQRLKKLNRDVAAIDLEREAVKEEILIKRVIKRDNAKIEARGEKLKKGKERLREKAKQGINNVKKRVATGEADGQAEAKKKRTEEEKLKSAVPLALREKLKQEAVNAMKRMTRGVVVTLRLRRKRRTPRTKYRLCLRVIGAARIQ